MLIDMLTDADWSWFMLIDTDWSWLILIDANSYWLMLIDADICWLMLIDADWCWLMLINADWCWLMLTDADWCSNKVQPGFLLSKRTSGASPVIFWTRFGLQHFLPTKNSSFQKDLVSNSKLSRFKGFCFRERRWDESDFWKTHPKCDTRRLVIVWIFCN